KDMEARAEEAGNSLGSDLGGKKAAYEKIIQSMKNDEAKFGGGAGGMRPATDEEVSAQLKAGVKPGQVKATVATGGEGQDVMLPLSQGHAYKQGLQAEGYASKVDTARGKPVAEAYQDAADAVKKQVVAGAGGENSAYAKAVKESHPYMMARVAEKDAGMKLAGAQGGVAAPAALPMAALAAATGHPVAAAAGMAGAVVQKQARARAQSTAYWALKKASGDAGTTTTGKIAQ